MTATEPYSPTIGRCSRVPARPRAARSWTLRGIPGTVSRVDPHSGLTVQTIRVGRDVSGIAVGGGAAWVTSRADGTVSRIDLNTNEIVQTIPVGSGLAAVAFGAGAVWVANAADRTLTRIDPASGHVVKAIKLAFPPTRVAAGDGAVWVTHETTGNVTKIDARTDEIETAVNVGNGPGAIAIDPHGVWVANNLDGTVSRIDPKTGAVRAAIPVGRGPIGIACDRNAVWVANEVSRTVSRIDPTVNVVESTIAIGSSPSGVAYSDGNLLVPARPSTGHRGGVLSSDIGSSLLKSLAEFDPALAGWSVSWQIASMVSDGLVAYKRIAGSDGATIVPDLAVTLPTPTHDGRAYGFQLRPGLRYSDGRPVRAHDVRASLERMFAVGSYAASYFTGIKGGQGCIAKPTACDLSAGVVTDDKTGRVVFHLVASDPEFLYKLAMPFASVLPSETPKRATLAHGTSPYMMASYRPGKLLRLVRNPYFKVWSSAAKPDGYPDVIRFTASTDPKRAIEAVKRGRLDYTADVDPKQRAPLRARFAGQLHEVTMAGTGFILLNTTLPPFDKLAVRKALSYAIDRAAITADGSGIPTCQYLPPGIAGYVPYCPYTRNPATGRWSAPDLAGARQLVAGTGTKGMRVTVLTGGHPPFRPRSRRSPRFAGSATTPSSRPCRSRSTGRPSTARLGLARCRRQPSPGGRTSPPRQGCSSRCFDARRHTAATSARPRSTETSPRRFASSRPTLARPSDNGRRSTGRSPTSRSACRCSTFVPSTSSRHGSAITSPTSTTACCSTRHGSGSSVAAVFPSRA